MNLPASWTDDDSLIACYLWSEQASGLKAKCELCHIEISAGPESIAKVKRTKGWHLVCIDCGVEIDDEHEVTFGGRYRIGETPPWEKT